MERLKPVIVTANGYSPDARLVDIMRLTVPIMLIRLVFDI